MYVADLVGVLQWIFLIGLVLAIAGQVGRRVFADNSCWRCQFDLSGHPGVPDGPFPVVCPECGESIAEAGMLKVDTRAPRVGLRRVGLLLMLAIVPVAVIYMHAGFTLDRYRVATNAGIIGLIGAGDYQARDEFKRRFAADRFTGAQREQIARNIEAMIQAMPQDRLEPGTWRSLMSITAMWGELYLDLIDAGDVTKVEAQELFDSITSFSLRFPLHNRVGDPMFFRVAFYGHRVGGEMTMVEDLGVRVESLCVGGVDLSSKPMELPNMTLTSDHETINTMNTLGTAWGVGIPQFAFEFSRDMVGQCDVEATVVVEFESKDELTHALVQPAQEGYAEGFTGQLLKRAYDGKRVYELDGALTVKPARDRESTRAFPTLTDILTEHARFELSEHSQSPDAPPLYRLTLYIDDGYELPDDAVIMAWLDRDAMGGYIIAGTKLTVLPDIRQAIKIISDEQGQITERGGVWVKLKAVDPLPRDQSWRPLVITGDVGPIWVPLE